MLFEYKHSPASPIFLPGGLRNKFSVTPGFLSNFGEVHETYILTCIYEFLYLAFENPEFTALSVRTGLGG